MKLLTIVSLCLALLLAIFTGEDRTVEKRVQELEAFLDGILVDDKPIKLTLGSNFLAKHGTVILLSKDEGMRRMVEYSRGNELEFSILFLPELGIWITDTKNRWQNLMERDGRYQTAVCSSGLKLWLGHVHSNIGDGPLVTKIRHPVLIQSAMPSDDDFVQLYAVTRGDCPDAEMYGFVSNVFGITYYVGGKRGWTAPIYVKHAIRQEAIRLNRNARNLPSERDLVKFAERHEGFVRLWFEPQYIKQ